MQEKLEAYLLEEIKEYRHKNYSLSMVVVALRGKITIWLASQDEIDMSYNGQTLLIMYVLCKAEIRVN